MYMRIKKIYVIIIATFLFVSCSSDGQKESKSSVGKNIETSKTKNPVEVSELTVMNYEMYEQIKHENSGNVGKLDLVASWCPPCREEIPGFIDAYNKNKDNLMIVGLSLDTQQGEATKFISEMGITYPVYLADNKLQRKFNIYTIPTNVIYKPSGELYNIHLGYLSKESIIELIQATI